MYMQYSMETSLSRCTYTFNMVITVWKLSSIAIEDSLHTILHIHVPIEDNLHTILHIHVPIEGSLHINITIYTTCTCT